MNSTKKGVDAPLSQTATANVTPLQFSAALTKDQIHQSEESQAGIDVDRRITLSVLTRDSDQLIKSGEKDMETLVEMIGQVSGFVERQESLLELAKMAEGRLLLVASELLEGLE